MEVDVVSCPIRFSPHLTLVRAYQILNSIITSPRSPTNCSISTYPQITHKMSSELDQKLAEMMALFEAEAQKLRAQYKDKPQQQTGNKLAQLITAGYGLL